LNPSRLTPAQQELVSDNLAIVGFLLARIAPRLPAHERDDAIQAGYVGLIVAAMRHKPALGEFKSYAFPCVRGAILRHLSDVRRHRGFVSLDAEHGDDGLDLAAALVAPVKDPDVAIDTGTILAAVADRLTPNEAEALIASTLNDRKATAARMGISKTRIGQLYMKALDKLRTRFGVESGADA
jgi:RNA polymerase sigma factor (sigma-70 family)